jgi:uncharacterized protein (TIGR00375 family)
MQFIADFHIHSKFSRATSSKTNIPNLALSAAFKGIKVLGTGDFTHPGWLEEIKRNLEEAEPGFLKLRPQVVNSLQKEAPFLKEKLQEVRFVFTTEVSTIFSRSGKVKKIHLLIFAPDLKTVEKINIKLGWIGNLKADGRPTFNTEAREILKTVLDISEDCLVACAHIWTPWFSLFGSRSGFDSIEECFGEDSKYIYALETGLSSNPQMNWRVSSLDRFTLISCSDAHSPEKIGREANVFNTSFDYFSMIRAVKEKDRQKFLYTIEFFPEEGKYHFDGHRLCQIRLSPKEREKYGGICPICQRPLTVGVLSRVEELADRENGFIPQNAVPYKTLVPLKEIISQSSVFEEAKTSVEEEYKRLILHLGSEFEILIEKSIEEIAKISPIVAQGIQRVREGKIKLIPGFDGEYGKVIIWDKEELQRKIPSQKQLF